MTCKMKPEEFTVTDEFRYRGLRVPNGICYILKNEFKKDGTRHFHLEHEERVTETKSVAQSIEIPQESVDKYFTTD